jgi:hypothetical protein
VLVDVAFLRVYLAGEAEVKTIRYSCNIVGDPSPFPQSSRTAAFVDLGY